MFGIGFGELLVILLVCLLLFGANRLPEIGKSLGEGIREFKRALKEGSDAPSKDQPEDKKKS
ncbi:MAG: twin-arginine translocase TatA/TatE family subunit [Candidatus Omnitrophica bacterium]|nr:twin-arginine translocase TatA/TatE family subunit [Candidatus Omnitrophota bacterium]